MKWLKKMYWTSRKESHLFMVMQEVGRGEEDKRKIGPKIETWKDEEDKGEDKED